MLERKEYFSRMAKAVRERKPELMRYIGLQILEDCNIYAREMSRTMINTSFSDVDGRGNAILEWNTPYAAKVYWTGEPRTEENPHASLRWCEVARNRHGREWKELVGSAFARMMLEEIGDDQQGD